MSKYYKFSSIGCHLVLFFVKQRPAYHLFPYILSFFFFFFFLFIFGLRLYQTQLVLFIYPGCILPQFSRTHSIVFIGGGPLILFVDDFFSSCRVHNSVNRRTSCWCMEREKRWNSSDAKFNKSLVSSLSLSLSLHVCLSPTSVSHTLFAFSLSHSACFSSGINCVFPANGETAVIKNCPPIPVDVSTKLLKRSASSLADSSLGKSTACSTDWLLL